MLAAAVTSARHSGLLAPWTHEWLVERLADAGDTLRRLPKPRGQEANLHAAWPEMLREWLAYSDEATRVPRSRPHPQAISRLDEVLAMLMWLTTTQRAVLWARHAERMTWPKIQFLDAQISRGHGRGQRQLQNILADAEARILNRLNGTPQRMVLRGDAEALGGLERPRPVVG